MTYRCQTDVTDDGILNGRLRLFQPKRGHRFGHDAILLAAIPVPARTANNVAEFGAGVGAASLALLARVTGVHATLFEIDEGLVRAGALEYRTATASFGSRPGDAPRCHDRNGHWLSVTLTGNTPITFL